MHLKMMNKNTSKHLKCKKYLLS